MAVSHTHREHAGFRRNLGAAQGGFTLVEMVTAILIMGIATSIFLSLYMGSVSLAEMSRDQRVAARLAEEYMTYILSYPEEFAWDEVSTGELAPVADPGPVEPPLSMPTLGRSFNRANSLYNNFLQEAYARIPGGEEGLGEEGSEDIDPDPVYLEVVVVIRWTQDGREKFFALTSTIARMILPESLST